MQSFEQHLPIGSVVDRYRVEKVLGIGGFGVTYLAFDSQLNCSVALKEFMPDDCAVRSPSNSHILAKTNRQDDYQYGLDRFLDEARTLAKFKHPNIVRVTNFLEANNTAYLVMDYEQGEALDDYLKRINFTGELPEAEILSIFKPILAGLGQVHQQGLLHRDIKPGNIYLRQDGEPMLIDFGAARYALGSQSRSISAIISMGYAPPEQYSSKGKQGPYSDLYALGATLYQLMAGQAPDESTHRREAMLEEEADPMLPVNQLTGSYSQNLRAAVAWCLQLSGKQRPQSAAQLLNALEQGRPDAETSAETNAETDASADKDSAAASKASANSSPNSGANARADGTRRVKDSERFGKKAKAKSSDQSESGTKSKSKRGTRSSNVAAQLPKRFTVLASLLLVLGLCGWWLWPAGAIDMDSFETFRDPLSGGGQGPVMVTLPKGSFQMGSNEGVDDEKPVHRVDIDYSIAMMQFEVSFGDYDKFANATGRQPPHDEGWGRTFNPVINVSWHDAVAYAQWLSQQTNKRYRLPSEAEWEYAARAGSQAKYSWGGRIGWNNANCDGCGSQWDKKSSAQGGHFEANKFGLYDMHGNVWEWVADNWCKSYQGAPIDGSAVQNKSCPLRALRGGSWFHLPFYLRSAMRSRSDPNERDIYTGFRLVQDLNQL